VLWGRITREGITTEALCPPGYGEHGEEDKPKREETKIICFHAAVLMDDGRASPQGIMPPGYRELREKW
jgi:hypothetical protein